MDKEDKEGANPKQNITISKLHGLTNINILEYYALEKLLFFDIDIEKKTKLLEYFYTAYCETEFTIGDEEITILNEIKTLNTDTIQNVECKKLGRDGDEIHTTEEFLQHIGKNNKDVIELFLKLINVKMGESDPFFKLFKNYKDYIDPGADQPSQEKVPFNSYMTIILSTILDFKNDFPFIPGQETIDDLLVNKLSETEIDLCEMEKTKYIFNEKSPLIYTQWVQIIIKYIIDGEMIGDMDNLNETKDIKKERENWEKKKTYIFKIINTIITNSDEQYIYKGKIFTSESIKKIITYYEKILYELTKTIKDIFNSLDSRLDSFQLNITKYSTFIANRDKKIETTYNTSLSTGNMVSLSPPPLLSGGATPAVAAQYPPFVEGSDAVRARSEEKREIENRKVLMAQFKENETRYIDILQKELDDIQSKKKTLSNILTLFGKIYSSNEEITIDEDLKSLSNRLQMSSIKSIQMSKDIIDRENNIYDESIKSKATLFNDSWKKIFTTLDSEIDSYFNEKQDLKLENKIKENPYTYYKSFSQKICELHNQNKNNTLIKNILFYLKTKIEAKKPNQTEVIILQDIYYQLMDIYFMDSILKPNLKNKTTLMKYNKSYKQYIFNELRDLSKKSGVNIKNLLLNQKDEDVFKVEDTGSMKTEADTVELSINDRVMLRTEISDPLPWKSTIASAAVINPTAAIGIALVPVLAIPAAIYYTSKISQSVAKDIDEHVREDFDEETKKLTEGKISLHYAQYRVVDPDKDGMVLLERDIASDGSWRLEDKKYSLKGDEGKEDAKRENVRRWKMEKEDIIYIGDWYLKPGTKVKYANDNSKKFLQDIKDYIRNDDYLSKEGTVVKHEKDGGIDYVHLVTSKNENIRVQLDKVRMAPTAKESRSLIELAVSSVRWISNNKEKHRIEEAAYTKYIRNIHPQYWLRLCNKQDMLEYSEPNLRIRNKLCFLRCAIKSASFFYDQNRRFNNYTKDILIHSWILYTELLLECEFVLQNHILSRGGKRDDNQWDFEKSGQLYSPTRTDIVFSKEVSGSYKDTLFTELAKYADPDKEFKNPDIAFLLYLMYEYELFNISYYPPDINQSKKANEYYQLATYSKYISSDDGFIQKIKSTRPSKKLKKYVESMKHNGFYSLEHFSSEKLNKTFKVHLIGHHDVSMLDDAFFHIGIVEKKKYEAFIKKKYSEEMRTSGYFKGKFVVKIDDRMKKEYRAIEYYPESKEYSIKDIKNSSGNATRVNEDTIQEVDLHKKKYSSEKKKLVGGADNASAEELLPSNKIVKNENEDLLIEWSKSFIQLFNTSKEKLSRITSSSEVIYITECDKNMKNGFLSDIGMYQALWIGKYLQEYIPKEQSVYFYSGQSAASMETAKLFSYIFMLYRENKESVGKFIYRLARVDKKEDIQSSKMKLTKLNILFKSTDSFSELVYSNETITRALPEYYNALRKPYESNDSIERKNIENRIIQLNGTGIHIVVLPDFYIHKKRITENRPQLFRYLNNNNIDVKEVMFNKKGGGEEDETIELTGGMNMVKSATAGINVLAHSRLSTSGTSKYDPLYNYIQTGSGYMFKQTDITLPFMVFNDMFILLKYVTKISDEDENTRAINNIHNKAQNEFTNVFKLIDSSLEQSPTDIKMEINNEITLALKNTSKHKEISLNVLQFYDKTSNVKSFDEYDKLMQSEIIMRDLSHYFAKYSKNINYVDNKCFISFNQSSAKERLVIFKKITHIARFMPHQYTDSKNIIELLPFLVTDIYPYEIKKKKNPIISDENYTGGAGRFLAKMSQKLPSSLITTSDLDKKKICVVTNNSDDAIIIPLGSIFTCVFNSNGEFYHGYHLHRQFINEYKLNIKYNTSNKASYLLGFQNVFASVFNNQELEVEKQNDLLYVKVLGKPLGEGFNISIDNQLFITVYNNRNIIQLPGMYKICGFVTNESNYVSINSFEMLFSYDISDGKPLMNKHMVVLQEEQLDTWKPNFEKFLDKQSKLQEDDFISNTSDTLKELQGEIAELKKKNSEMMKDKKELQDQIITLKQKIDNKKGGGNGENQTQDEKKELDLKMEELEKINKKIEYEKLEQLISDKKKEEEEKKKENLFQHIINEWEVKIKELYDFIYFDAKNPTKKKGIIGGNNDSMIQEGGFNLFTKKVNAPEDKSLKNDKIALERTYLKLKEHQLERVKQYSNLNDAIRNSNVDLEAKSSENIRKLNRKSYRTWTNSILLEDFDKQIEKAKRILDKYNDELLKKSVKNPSFFKSNIDKEIYQTQIKRNAQKKILDERERIRKEIDEELSKEDEGSINIRDLIVDFRKLKDVGEESATFRIFASKSQEEKDRKFHYQEIEKGEKEIKKLNKKLDKYIKQKKKCKEGSPKCKHIQRKIEMMAEKITQHTKLNESRKEMFEKYSSLPKDSPERKLLQSKLEDISSTRANVTIKDQEKDLKQMRRDHQKMDKVLQEKKKKLQKISSTLSPTQYAEALKEVQVREEYQEKKEEFMKKKQDLYNKLNDPTISSEQKDEIKKELNQLQRNWADTNEEYAREIDLPEKKREQTEKIVEQYQDEKEDYEEEKQELMEQLQDPTISRKEKLKIQKELNKLEKTWEKKKAKYDKDIIEEAEEEDKDAEKGVDKIMESDLDKKQEEEKQIKKKREEQDRIRNEQRKQEDDVKKEQLISEEEKEKIIEERKNEDTRIELERLKEDMKRQEEVKEKEKELEKEKMTEEEEEIKQSILQKKEADMQDTGLKQTMDDLDMARSLGDSVGKDGDNIEIRATLQRSVIEDLLRRSAVLGMDTNSWFNQWGEELEMPPYQKAIAKSIANASKEMSGEPKEEPSEDKQEEPSEDKQEEPSEDKQEEPSEEKDKAPEE